MENVLPPLLLSLKIASVATAMVALVVIPVAFLMARGRPFFGKSVVEGLLLVPLVLPPTVVGYLIIVLFGANGWLTGWLHRRFDYSILFRFEGAVFAAAVVALPMLYMPAKAAFAGIDRDLEDTAVVMGATRWQLFRLVSLPLARRGVAAGLLLAFARAMGEFGATVMVFGKSRLSFAADGTIRYDNVTLPIAIYDDYERGELGDATPAVIALLVVSLALVFAYNRAIKPRRT
jgi:molybdate transport system permease protein